MEAWGNIQEEYSDSIKHGKGKGVFEAGKALVYNQWKLNFVALCLEALKTEYDVSIAERLSSLGYDFIADTEDKEAYLKQIYAVEGEAKFLIVQQNALYKEYQKLTGTNNAPVKRSLIDFEKELRILSKYMGYSIKKEQITVVEFCSIVNAYVDEMESLKKAANE